MSSLGIKNIIHRHLGRKLDALKLFVDIRAVDVGIKPAYLYDVSNPDCRKLQDLLKELHSNVFIQNNLNIVSIAMDCLIVNVVEIQNLTLKTREDVKAACIDVSAGGKQPMLLRETQPVTSIVATCKQIASRLNTEQVIVIEANCTEDCNVSSMFGFLLNYPVIYWYDMTDRQGENCLALEQLTVVKLTTRLEPLTRDGELVRLASTGYEHALYQLASTGYEHALYQFSYPSALEEHCKALMERWLHALQVKLKQSPVFSSAQISTEEVQLEAVIL